MTELIQKPWGRERTDAYDGGLNVITPQSPDFEEWLSLRQEFMERQNWHFGNDYDSYDENPATFQIIKKNRHGVAAGLRLTPRPDIQSTMTWSWLPLDLRVAAADTMPPSTAPIWDLTRLVATEMSRDEAPRAMIELFGAGLEATRQFSDNPRWIFATSIPFYRYFCRLGLNFQPIVQGKFSDEDNHDSILCFAEPAMVAENLYNCTEHTSRMVMENAKKGMAAMAVRTYQL